MTKMIQRIGAGLALAGTLGAGAPALAQNYTVTQDNKVTAQVFQAHPNPTIEQHTAAFGKAELGVDYQLRDDVTLHASASIGSVNREGFTRDSQFGLESAQVELEQAYVRADLGSIGLDDTTLTVGMFNPAPRPLYGDITDSITVARPGVSVTHDFGQFTGTLEQLFAYDVNNGPRANTTNVFAKGTVLDTDLVKVMATVGGHYSWNADESFALTNELENGSYPDFLEVDALVGVALKPLTNPITGTPVVFAYGLDNVLAENDGSAFVTGINLPNVASDIVPGHLAVKGFYVPEGLGKNATLAGFRATNIPPVGIDTAFGIEARYDLPELGTLEEGTFGLNAAHYEAWLPFANDFHASNNIVTLKVDGLKLAEGLNDLF